MPNALVSFVVSLLAPPFCGHCHIYMGKRDPLCANCLAKIELVLSVKRGSLTVRALSCYEYPLRSLINKSYETSLQLGTLLWERSVSSLDVDCLIPVPVFKKQLSNKGYNASMVMAQQVRKLSSIPVVECIRRVKSPLRKGLYNKVEHQRYMEDAFRVMPDISKIEGKRVLLIDEVCSSGSTVVEVAKQVALGRPKSVEVLVVCRVER